MKTDSGNSQLCALLSYLLVGIIWYFADDNMKKDSFVKFHVKQAIILFIFSIAWSVLLRILVVLVFYLGPIFFVLNYVPLILTIIGIIYALNKQEKDLPVIGSYAKKLTF